MLQQLNLRTLGVATLLALTVLGAGLANAAAPAKGNPAAGKPLFATKCVACHKADGSGGVKLTGNPTPNWKDPKTWADPKRKDADAFMRDCIQNGKIKSGMVAWGKTGQLKPQQIEDLIAYIHTLAPKKK
ncbi:MAG: cytochrome c [Candidatus Eisenbacteria bacterium]